MDKGHLITILVATAYVTIAFINVFTPPIDLLEKLRSGVYTAYFNWGLISADGSHAYAEAYGYKIAVNLWKIVICDEKCTSQEINFITLYLQLKAKGALNIISKDGCYYVELRQAEIARRKITAKGDVCFKNATPYKINLDVWIDGEKLEIRGETRRVERRFLFDKYYAIHGE